MRYLPIHIDTQNARILVVGAGPAAEAKLRTLLKTQADILVVAESLSLEIAKWESEGKIRWMARDFHPNDLEGARLVYAATEDDARNGEIADMAAAANIPTNAADYKAACTFITPALVDRAPVVVSIGTEGTSPGLGRALKSDMETRLPSTLGALALTTQRLRATVKEIMPALSARQRFWADIFKSKTLDDVLRYDEAGLTARVEAELADESPQDTQIFLVGAGPGDPDLLTIAARRALHSADVIIYDRLVSQPVLDLGRREADYIYVGKTPGEPSIGQAAINAILLDKAREGGRIVRLKSGDPLVFGRADEELDALYDAGFAATIVPGITAAASAAAEMRQSLTTRGRNSAVTFMTGHDAKGFAEQDWKKLAQTGARAAVYMGVGASGFIQGRLLMHGASRDQSVCVVENASRPDQIILNTTLGELSDAIVQRGIKGPAVLMLGYGARAEALFKTTQKVAK